MSDEFDDVLNEFIVESREGLDQLDRDLVTLERESTPDVLASIFRAVHTIKGTAGFFGFEKLEAVAHVGENLLSRLRDGELRADRAITTALLVMVDALREMIEGIESSGIEGEGDYSELVAELERLERAEPGDALVEDTESTESMESMESMEPVESVESMDSVEPVGQEPTQMPRAETPEAPDLNGSVSHSSESIRVDVGLLDDLMNLVGELVLTRNQIIQYTGTQGDSSYTATTQRLNLITTELQEGVMRTRMQPIENIWNKFPRVVRDLSVACGKQARLLMEGKHTELDKTLLEAIKDPLTHLVRNSVDHGLELPAARALAGKPEEGTVRLRAYHEGGQVIIEISDDGRGIDTDVIRRKAVEKGLLGAEEAANRSDREIVNVIFQPGFSTAAEVTNISGRGVGMDVVRTNIEAIGGSVDVQSNLGHGTTFKVKIPLTLAIIPALVVTCDGDRYAIPQVSLRELVRIDAQQTQTGIELVDGVPVYRLRGRLLPIVYLHEVFGKEAPDPAGGVNMVVLRADDREFGLVVDDISDTAEIVVKPLGRLLKQVSAFAGATIMGDGRVALILDVLGIAEHVGMALARQGRSAVDDGLDAAHRDGDARRLLMLRVGDRRVALPVDAVARLEEFHPDQVEITGSGPVVQYRGEIMHLVDVARQIGVPSSRSEAAPFEVVVYSNGNRQIGIVVDEITDVVEEAIQIENANTTGSYLGSAVIQGRVTDILDVEAVLRSGIPGLSTTEAA